MPITPDTKNWTWVLERSCDECGFDSSTVEAQHVASLLRRNAAAWPAVLRRTTVRLRPDESTWSPLEYAAHVRDVFRLYEQRLGLMQSSDDPLYPNWDQDATAVSERYNEQDPAAVSAELTAAADSMAAALDQVEDWSRPGRRGDGVRFTIESFAKYFIHDPIHHLHDVMERQAESAPQSIS
ncbi:MAG: DinB family protein [Salinibacterium sp.]|nr:DinB family protein [Salinibacterium sp.]